jgi:predicted transcriptional regulator
VRIRSKEIHRTRKRQEERIRAKIKSLRTVKPVSTSRPAPRTGGTRPAAKPAAPQRAPRPRPAGQGSAERPRGE